MSIEVKTARIDLRVTESEKALLEQVCEEQKMSLSNYIMSIVLKQAALDMEANKKVDLNKKQWDFVMDLLDNPPEPTESLKDLFRWLRLFLILSVFSNAKNSQEANIVLPNCFDKEEMGILKFDWL